VKHSTGYNIAAIAYQLYDGRIWKKLKDPVNHGVSSAWVGCHLVNQNRFSGVFPPQLKRHLCKTGRQFFGVQVGTDRQVLTYRSLRQCFSILVHRHAEAAGPGPVDNIKVRTKEPILTAGNLWMFVQCLL
jgi:hypothetical protein